MKIGDRIKILRTELKISQEAVGNKIGVSKQTIQRYESGEISNIPSDKIEKLASALGTSPAYLMGWTEKKDNNKYYYKNEKHDAIIEALDKLNADDIDRVMDLINRLNK